MSQYIVLDLEWNQSSRGKEGSVNCLPFEIIEIGAVKLNENFRTVSEFHRLIRPRVYRQMHFKISEVTHMSMEELEHEGLKFEDAVEEFIDWCGDDYVLCTWGNMDLTELQRNMVYHGLEIPFPFPLFYYDVQKIYSLLHSDGKQKDSLDRVVEELGLLEGRPFHRALDDAYYTGRVMASVDFGRMKDYISVGYYRLPEYPDEEIYLKFPSYSKFVSRTFETKEEAVSEKYITDVVCYKCGRTLRKKIRWFLANQKVYLCLAVCPEHGPVKAKIRIKKAEDGSLYVVKTAKITDEEGVDKLLAKREEARRKRVEKNKLKRAAKKALRS